MLRFVFVLLLTASLFVNVIMMSWSAGAFFIAKTFDLVTGTSSVISEMQISNQNLKKQTVGLQEQNQSLKKQTVQLQKKNSNLSKKHFELTETIKKNDAVASKRKQLVSETSKRIQKRTAKSAFRSVVAVPAEAIPFIGVFVVFSVTSWELYDACNTMKDLAVLSKYLNDGEAEDTNEVCGLKIPSLLDIFKERKDSPKEALEEVYELIGTTPPY